jgi:hypothetical protein
MRPMSTAATPNTKPVEWVWFKTAKNDRKMAFRFSRSQFRAFRMPLADAEMWVATGVAEKLNGHPFPGNGLR